ncbi:TonB-dependent receptor family protein [Undibacterium sp. Ren11W]|uniref:TonB-dependent receptor family protein n=1 Tax=Undibacterium sp. Ren11W TaxID=3413045 RepID=UPI003BF212D6
MNFKHTPLAFALLAAFTQMAYAAEPQVLEEMVVSGSRSATKLSETPVAIGVVKEEVLKRDKPKTMGEVINRVAGVYWNDLGNEQHSMSIRQPISTNAVYQYLEDGIPIRPLGVFNHNSLNEMNLAGTESVEVVKGAASSLYGSNAVGGAVNFMTARPSATPYASISARYEDVSGYKRIDTIASNTWGDLGLRFSQYSSRRTADNWQQYSKGDKDSVSLRGDYALSDSAILRATLVHTDLDVAMTGGLNETDYQNTPGKSINSFTYRKDKTTRANLAWEAETVKNGLTTVTLFSRKNDHGQIPSYTLVGCSAKAKLCQGTENNSHVDSLGLDAKHQQEFDWLASRLIAGVYLDKSDNPYYSNNLSVVRDPVTGMNLSYSNANASNPKGVRNYQADINNTAFFTQWEFSPLPKTRVVVGARADAISYDYTNNLSPAGSVNYGAANESRSFSHVSPKLGATYALGKDSSVYSNLSQGFTPPEVSQLYGKTGIPDLNPATYNNYELGLRMAFLDGALKLDTAVYRLDGRDTIVSYTIAQGNSENRNAGSTRSQGLELGLNYDAGLFDARLATTLASHKYEKYQVSGSIDYSGKQMPQAPSDITSAELGYKPVTGARIALELVHQGEYWMNNANTVRYAGHTLLNLRGSYLLAKGWEVWLQARNLADTRYADSASSSYSGTGAYVPDTQNSYTPGAPRSVMLGVTYAYGGK